MDTDIAGKLSARSWLVRIGNSFALAAAALLIGSQLIEEGPKPLPVATRPGDRLWALSTAGKRGASRTLVIVTSSSCHFCRESLPFYRRLAPSLKAGNTRLVALSWEPPAENRAFLARNGVNVDVADSLRRFDIDVTGTPVLILADQEGKVLKSWIGKLDSSSENDVLRSVVAN